MDQHLQRIYDIMLSNQATGSVVVVAIVVLLWTNRTTVSLLLEEPDRFWRWVQRAFMATAGLTIVWLTTSDNWLQLVTEPYRVSQRWESQRVVLDPVAPEFRIVSLVLVCLTAIIAAALFARYIGGYFLQLSLLLPAVLGWFAIFIFRQRLDMIVNTIPTGADASLPDFAGFLGFWVLRSGAGLISIGLSWGLIVLLLAPPVTALLDCLKLRAPRIGTEAVPFYSALEQTAATYADVPLATRWKPIRPR